MTLSEKSIQAAIEMNDKIFAQADRIEELEAQNAELLEALEAIIRKQDTDSMFRLPDNCKEILQARLLIKKAKCE